MKNILKKKKILSLILLITFILSLQIFSLAKAEDIQMIKKSDNQYIIYISDLLNQEFEFAFSNSNDEDKNNLIFQKSALDKEENGNNIAYADEEIYIQYFKGKEHTYIWIKQGEEYKIEAQEINLSVALSEEQIQNINNLTKMIKVEIGEKSLPEEVVDEVKVNRKIGTLIMKDNFKGYEYQIFKANEGTDENKLIELVNQVNNLTDKNIFEKLQVYSEFEELYTKLEPSVNDEDWIEVEENTIEQPLDSKEGDKYVVWIKGKTENSSDIDIQIMTCAEEYIPEYEKQERIVKEIYKLPITGDNMTLFIIAGMLVILITIVVVLKIKNINNHRKS